MTQQRVVLITGASSGSGRAIAALLARRGYRVFGTSRRPASPTLDGFELLELEVTDDESVARCIATVVARAGRLDALVNNAGVTQPGAVEEIDVDAARALFEVNFFGVARVTRAALPYLRASRGRVINVSSGFGRVGVPFDAYYSASKHALEGWSESLRQEVAPLGVRVSLVEPGFFRSDIAGAGRQRPPALDVYQPQRDHALDLFDRSVRDGADPTIVANAVYRLLEAPSPPLRVAVGGSARLLLLGNRLVPYPLFVRAFRLIYGLNRWQDAARRVAPLALLVAALAWSARRRR
jgi:NAD(P)-dependent dehydrogenase (short-subunit alcohol dehydrogenase family)